MTRLQRLLIPVGMVLWVACSDSGSTSPGVDTNTVTDTESAMDQHAQPPPEEDTAPPEVIQDSDIPTRDQDTGVTLDSSNHQDSEGDLNTDSHEIGDTSTGPDQDFQSDTGLEKDTASDIPPKPSTLSYYLVGDPAAGSRVLQQTAHGR